MGDAWGIDTPSMGDRWGIDGGSMGYHTVSDTVSESDTETESENISETESEPGNLEENKSTTIVGQNDQSKKAKGNGKDTSPNKKVESERK